MQTTTTTNPTKFTFASPESPKVGDNEVHKDTKQGNPPERDIIDRGNANESENDQLIDNNNDNNGNGNGNDKSRDNDQRNRLDNNSNDEDKSETADLMFKKKNVKKSRNQSFLSVLSTASLKSLNQNYTDPNLQRQNSTISNSNLSNSKNFQSFIQAPVLSSITNLKSNDEIEIGRRTPFVNNDSINEDEKSSFADNNDNDSIIPNNSNTDNGSQNDDEYNDQDTILQQQKLTLNALKKLSLSPLPKMHEEEEGEESQNQATNRPQAKAIRPKGSVSSINTTSLLKKAEPYQPAQVDLSSFASLTRQPKINSRNLSVEERPSSLSKSSSTTTNSNAVTPEQKFSPHSSEQQQPFSQLQATQKYHNEVHKNHVNNLKSLDTNPLINDLHLRRTSNNLSPVTNSLQKLPQPNSSQTQIEGNQLPSSTTESQSSTPQPTTGGNQDQRQHYLYNNKRNRNLQHIKGLRSPMYVPAVLRMTINQNSSSSTNSQVSKNQLEDDLRQFNNNRNTRSSATSLRSFDSNMSTESVNSLLMLSPSTSNYTVKNYEHFLRQPPSKKHWLKDESVYKCGIKNCDKEFNFFERRHHCRKCGGIFCKEHTSHYLYINHLAQFTTGGRGTLSRVCSNCIQEYNEFMKHEFGMTSDSTINKIKDNLMTSNSNVDYPARLPNQALPSPNSPSIYDKNLETSNKNNNQQQQQPVNKHINKPYLETNEREQVAGSVPANWSWSSF